MNCIFFKGTAKTNLAIFLFKLMPFPNEEKIEILDWRQMKQFSKGLKNGLRFKLVFLIFNGAINHSKVRLFFKIRIV